MTAKKYDKFDEFIEGQSKTAQTKEADLSKLLKDWQDQVDTFYDSVKSFLKPYLDNGKVSIRFTKKKIFEDQIGEYEVPSAVIGLGATLVKLDPVGTFIIGARGRIDMIGPNGVIKFLLVDKNASEAKLSVRVHILEPGSDRKKPQKKIRTEDIEWVWKIATQPPQIKFFPFTDESFFDALMEVTNG